MEAKYVGTLKLLLISTRCKEGKEIYFNIKITFYLLQLLELRQSKKRKVNK